MNEGKLADPAPAEFPESSSDSPQRIVLKNPFWSAFSAFLWSVLLVVAWAVPLNLLLPESAIGPVLIPTGFLIVGVVLWRALRMALIVDHDGIRAHNILRDHAARWDEIYEITACNGEALFTTVIDFKLRRRLALGGAAGIAPQATYPGYRAEDRRRLLNVLRTEARKRGIKFALYLDGTRFDRPPGVASDRNPPEDGQA